MFLCNAVEFATNQTLSIEKAKITFTIETEQNIFSISTGERRRSDLLTLSKEIKYSGTPLNLLDACVFVFPLGIWTG